MAYIDPDGMFGGDRMAMLSDPAKMAWPWFWCASNTVGRVELNYRDFVKTVFRQFKKPPTEEQFWNWVSEFHESYLMFVYEVSGQVWGQWWVSEKYLPTYKTVSDKRTPAPMVDAALGWQGKYDELKVSLISGKCRVLNISKTFQKVYDAPKTSEEFPIGEERRGEIEEREEVNLSPIGIGAEPEPTLFPVDEKRGAAWFDRSFERFWIHCWYKTGKVDARKAYEKRVRGLVKDGGTFEAVERFLIAAIIDDRKRFEGTEDWDWRCHLHPATWLNGHRWEDQAPPARASPSRKAGFVDQVTRQIEESLARGEKPW